MAPTDRFDPAAPSSRPGAWSIVGSCAPPLVLAVAGVLHPMDLSAASSERWRDLHIVLLPVFPLLGLAPWLAVAGEHRTVRRVAVVLGYVYAVFYSALDALAGIGTGTLIHVDPTSDVKPLFEVANALAQVGVIAFLLATLLAGGVLLRRYRLAAVPGVVLVLAASVSFLTSHIYWPRGVATMLCLALGWGWLLAVRRRAAGPGRATSP